MKKGQKVLVVIVAVIVTLVIVAAIGWTLIANKINEYEGFILNDGAADCRIAIILDNSDYKDELARTIGSRLGAGVRTDAFGLQEIKDVNESSYDAVIIMAPVYAGKLQSDARKWIEGMDEIHKVVLFETNGGQSEVMMPVDMVTSATPQMEGSTVDPIPVSDMADIIITKLKLGN